MPVHGYKPSSIPNTRYGRFTFQMPGWATIERLKGPRFLTVKQFESEAIRPTGPNPRVEAFRVWDQTIAPIGEHRTCLPGH